MYKCTLYETTCFEAVMVMNLSELRSEACFCESNPRMGDFLGSLVWGAKSGQYCVIGWVVTNGIRAIAQPEMVGACTSLRGSPAGMLGPKRG
jgi:hypothetical protein